MKRLVIAAVSLAALWAAQPALAQTPSVSFAAACGVGTTTGQVRTDFTLTFSGFPAAGTTTANILFGIDAPPTPAFRSPFIFSGSSGVFSLADVDDPNVTRRATIVVSYSSTAGVTGTFSDSLTYNCPLPAVSAPVTPAVIESIPARAGYCLNAKFFDLQRDQPAKDPAYAGATPAFYYEGLGISCDRLPGYTATGGLVNGSGIDLGPIIGPQDPGRIYPYLRRARA